MDSNKPRPGKDPVSIDELYGIPPEPALHKLLLEEAMTRGKASLRSGWIAVVIVIGILLVVLALLGERQPSPRSPDAGLRTDAEERALQGRGVALAQMQLIKSAMRDPASFDPIVAQGNPAGTELCVRYRARNGFGGLTIEEAWIHNGKAQILGKGGWGKHCLGNDWVRLL